MICPVRPGIWPLERRPASSPVPHAPRDLGPSGLGGEPHHCHWSQRLPDTRGDQAFGHPTAQEQWAFSLPLKAAAGEITVFLILSGGLMGRRLPHPWVGCSAALLLPPPPSATSSPSSAGLGETSRRLGGSGCPTPLSTWLSPWSARPALKRSPLGQGWRIGGRGPGSPTRPPMRRPRAAPVRLTVLGPSSALASLIYLLLTRIFNLTHFPQTPGDFRDHVSCRVRSP